MEVDVFVNTVCRSNSFVIKLSDSDICFLIDCGDICTLQSYFNKYRFSLKGVFLTHTHFDHIYGLNGLLQFYPELPVYTSAFGREALMSDKLNLSKYTSTPFLFRYLQNVKVLEEGNRILLWGNKELEVMETPGHDKSCLTYKLNNFLFTGDSYIPGMNVVATFPNSNRVEAEISKKRILELAKACKIYPGHGQCYE